MESIFTEEKLPTWKALRNSLLSTHFPMRRPKFMSLDSYKLIHVWVDDNGKAIKKSVGKRDEEAYFIFTSEQYTGQAQLACSLEEVQSELTINFAKSPQVKLKTMMLGEFVRELATEPKVCAIKVNPVLVDLGKDEGQMYFCEEVLFAPHFDETTKKYLLTDPDMAKALLSVSEQDQSRFGIELVFYMLSGRELPDGKEEREKILRKKLEEMSFILPRVPIKKGSGSFLTVILNLDSEIQESAFIREYKLFDNHSDPLFVTSSFKLLTGQLEEIHYNGDQIDTIFTPMIQWQESKHNRRVNQ
tara:strand:+ start:30871 stop:31776 length:906 start_codon:yes stop_codon:yes gene_type:complete